MFRRAAKQVALILPPIRRLVEQRDAALRKLEDVRARAEMPQSPLPVGQHLAAAPDSQARCAPVLADIARQRDQALFERDDANALVRRLVAENSVLIEELAALRGAPVAPLFAPPDRAGGEEA